MNALFAFLAMSFLSPLRETIAAIHGTVAARLEGNLGRLAALAADRAEHLAGPAAAATAAAAAAETTAAATAPAATTARGLLRRAARRAPLGLVREPELREPLLFARRKGELRSTIDARQRLVRVHG